MKKDKLYKAILYVCIGIFVGSVLYRIFINCIWGTPSFDGAMNLQVPLQLLKSGKYMTIYDGGMVFDPRIQTRLPVLLPIYFLWKIFGVSVVSALAVNALYILALLFICFEICQELGISKSQIWGIIAVVTIVPSIWNFGMGIYGEIPTTTLFLASVLFLIKVEREKNIIKNMFFSGLFFSLAFLNKTVILIAVPSFMILYIYKIFWEKSLKIKTVVIWFISFAIPVMLEACFHIYQIGDINEYFLTVKNEIFSVGKQAGVVSGYSDTSGIFIKCWQHLKILSKESIIFNEYIVITILSIVFGLWIYNFIRLKKITYFSIIILTMFSYFGWWLLITPTGKAWYRRIIIGVILLFFVVGIFIYKILENIRIKSIICNIGCNIGLIGLVLVVSIFHLNSSLKADKTFKEDNIEMANEIKRIRRENPDAKFYAYAWYQAPLLSFFADETFYNLLNHKVENHDSYLVLDWASLGEGGAENILRNFETELCMQNASGKIFKLNEIDVYKYNFQSELSSIDDDTVKKNSYDVSEEYSGIIGVSRFESNNVARWATTNVELLLNNVDKKRLHLDIQIAAYENMNSFPMIIYIMIDNDIVDSIEVTGNGKIDHYIEGQVAARKGIRDIRLFTNSYIKTSKDSRQLSYLLKNVQFVD